MNRREKKLGEILVDKGIIGAAQLADALEEQKATREFLGAILVKKGYVKERDFLKALSEQFNIPLAGLKDVYIDWDFVKGFSPSLIIQNKCFPLKKDEWSVMIAITNPLDVWALKKAEEEAKGLKANFVLVSQEDMEEIIERYRQFMRGTISGMLG